MLLFLLAIQNLVAASQLPIWSPWLVLPPELCLGGVREMFWWSRPDWCQEHPKN